MASFLDLYGNVSLRELVANWRPEPVDESHGDYFHFPPEAFLSWARSFPRYPFDKNPSIAYIAKAPTFLLSQTHRVWLSSKLVVDHCGLTADLVDFGSFPFVVPLALRSYFKYAGGITGTLIQPLSDTSREILEKYRIQLAFLDLDPFVQDHRRLADGSTPLPQSLDRPSESADVVTMFHVIEHLYHPMSALSEAGRVLRKGGYLIITTDNAMMLNTLLNYISGYGYVFEPVELTAAMAMHDWRGHVRFFTDTDLRTMTAAAGFSPVTVGFEQVFYDAFHPELFEQPMPLLPGWQREILRKHRQFANDVYLVARRM